MRDYLTWHEQYDDPSSSLPRRLALVRAAIRAELDARPGPVRVVSLCAGDGRDLLGTLAGRDDAGRVSATLVEVLPDLVERAREAAAGLAADVEVVRGDAGASDTYADLATVPADVVLLVGVLGNVTDLDVATLVAALPQLCAPGASWCGAGAAAPTAPPTLRAAGARGVHRRRLRRGEPHAVRRRDDHTALGVVRYDGPAVPLGRGAQWFTFVG